MSPEAVTTQPGFFGKLPGRGDFVQRALPRRFVDTWDEWLQQAIAGSKERLAGSWLDTYLGSPIWRFALAAGAGGETPWCGVLMPSVDRVGRYFPLTIAVAAPTVPYPLAAAVHAGAWYAEAERLALSALDDGEFDLDAFSGAVAALGACRVSDAQTLGEPPLPGSAWHLPLPAVDGAGATAAAVCDRLIGERVGTYSLWWCGGSELVQPCMLACDGLPDGERFTALLDGNWTERGWAGWPATPAAALESLA